MNGDRRDHTSGQPDGAGDTLRVARSAIRELAHLLTGIAVQAAGLQRQVSAETAGEVADALAAIEAEAWRGFTVSARAEARFRRLLGPARRSTTRGVAS